ncbi:energy-coupling factor ABC transporter ATP-binding protein [Halovenus salina]|uniref:Energy-coupling factor ABC transporter ATP-binding protein n=1 Tax=Halovenus salina TaxID=1510225 RepID=A0ABD5W3D2_9EURY|nr:ABC transporter ATP-binding protein [Halovenus salina]
MIRVENLTATYGEVIAVDDISVNIDDGGFVLVVGANGSGKTTFVRHLNALLEPEEGTVEVDGIDVTADPIAARANIGMVFQQPRDQFVAATIGADVAFGPENLGLDREEVDRRVESALQAVNLDGRANDRIDELSGGEQARVAIAGALAMEPSYLVLDEPFTGLDQPARESVLDQLDALQADGTGILVVTHDLRDLHSRADRLLGMHDGRIVVDGPPREVAEELPGIDVRVVEGLR